MFHFIIKEVQVLYFITKYVRAIKISSLKPEIIFAMSISSEELFTL